MEASVETTKQHLDAGLQEASPGQCLLLLSHKIGEQQEKGYVLH